MEVKGYDLFEPLVYFWQYVLAFPGDLADMAEMYYPCSKETFQLTYEAMKNCEFDDFGMAVAYYVVNRCSYSALTTHVCGYSPGHKSFTPEYY